MLKLTTAFLSNKVSMVTLFLSYLSVYSVQTVDNRNSFNMQLVFHLFQLTDVVKSTRGTATFFSYLFFIVIFKNYPAGILPIKDSTINLADRNAEKIIRRLFQ